METETISRIIGAHVRTVHRMGGGVNNPTYEAICEDATTLIVQVISARFPRKAEREQRIVPYLAGKQVPVARIIRADTSKTIIGSDFIIKERLSGTTLREAHLDDQQIPALYRQIGSLLDSMHSVRFEAFGELDFSSENPTVRNGTQQYRDAAHAEFSEYITHAETTPFASYREELEEWMGRNIEVFGSDIEPCLTHNDFANTNIMVESGRVTGIIDFDNLASSNPLSDIYRIHQHLEQNLIPLALKSFFEAYTQKLPDNHEKQVSFYLATHCLAYLACWHGIEATYEPKALEAFIETMHTDIRSLLRTSFV